MRWRRASSTVTDRYIRQSWIHSHKVCPRGTLLSYGLDGTGYQFPPSDKPLSGKRDVGTQVHLGVEAINKGLEPLPVMDAAKKAHQELTAALGLPWSKEWEEVYVLSRIMVAGYVDWLAETAANAGEETVGVEIPFEVVMPLPILGDRVIITGRVDHLIRDTFTNELIVEDTKTVDGLDAAVEMLQIDDQGRNYCILASASLGEHVNRFRHNMLRKVKRTAKAVPPFYGRHAVRYSEVQLNNSWRHLYRTVEDIVAQLQAVEQDRDRHHDWPPVPSKDCSWRCDFKHICPVMDTDHDWHGAVTTSGLYIAREGKA